MTSDAFPVLEEIPQMLDPGGQLVGAVPDGLTDDNLVELMRIMLKARTYDESSLKACHDGAFGTYYQSSGQEAIAASAFAYDMRDFVYPAYREAGMWFARGLSVRSALARYSGIPDDGWDVVSTRMARIAVTLGSQIPQATGWAEAARLRGSDEIAVVYFGDGASSQGEMHTAMNFAGVWKSPVIFLCVNNLYAQSTPYHMQTAARSIADRGVGVGVPAIKVDGMDPLAVYEATRRAVVRARTGGGPTLIEATAYRYGAHASYDTHIPHRTDEEIALWKSRDPVNRMRAFLVARGLWNDDLEKEVVDTTVKEVHDAAAEAQDPELLSRDFLVRHVFEHVPVAMAERLNNEQAAHGEPLTEFTADELWTPDDEPTVGGPRVEMGLGEAVNRALYQALERDPNVVVVGEDVGIYGGPWTITRGLHDKFGDARVIDTPLNEVGIIGASVGMAMNGLRPVAEMEFAGFSYMAFDQIMGHAARMRWRTRGQVSVPITIRMPGGAGHGGLEFHLDSPETLYAHSPGLVVVYPSNPYDAKGLLAASIASNDPVIYMEPIALYDGPIAEVPTDYYEIPLGKAAVVRPGSDLTIVGYGPPVLAAITAAEELANEGIEVEVVDLRTVYPWDEQTVLDSVRRTGRLVTVHEAVVTAGIGAEVAATVAEKAAEALKGAVQRVAHNHQPWSPSKLEVNSAITVERILAAAGKALA